MCSCRAQRAYGVRCRRGNQVRIEVRPQRVVYAEDHARDIGPQPERPGQLLALDLGDGCAAGGQDVQLSVGQTVGKQGRPAAPGAPVAGQIADAERDRVTERREGGHANAPTAATPSTAS